MSSRITRSNVNEGQENQLRVLMAEMLANFAPYKSAIHKELS